MYTDQSHPHFLDIKELNNGTTITYFSDAIGAERTVAASEPFGNWLYGYVGVMGNIGEAMLEFAAAVFQQGDAWYSIADDPADAVHVQAGVDAAVRYRDQGIAPNLDTMDSQSCA